MAYAFSVKYFTYYMISNEKNIFNVVKEKKIRAKIPIIQPTIVKFNVTNLSFKKVVSLVGIPNDALFKPKVLDVHISCFYSHTSPFFSLFEINQH